jgi:hypothetical protein
MGSMIVKCRPNASGQVKKCKIQIQNRPKYNQSATSSKSLLLVLYEQDLCVLTSQPPRKSWFDNQRQSVQLLRRLALHHSCVTSCNILNTHTVTGLGHWPSGVHTETRPISGTPVTICSAENSTILDTVQDCASK